jgi:hypothetical protein
MPLAVIFVGRPSNARGTNVRAIRNEGEMKGTGNFSKCPMM